MDRLVRCTDAAAPGGKEAESPTERRVGFASPSTAHQVAKTIEGRYMEEPDLEEKKITIEEARRLLNRVKDGEDIPVAEVALALKVTGDIT